ncbi:MAG TPA: hypothetical protein VF493_14300 [Terriglobales bacterium]
MALRFVSKSTQGNFWKWFVEHEAELFDFEADQERIFRQLQAALHRVHPDLTFEFGPKDGRREFVISAGGIKSAFPAVVALAKAAPELPKWQVTAFRPRREAVGIVEFQNKRVDPKDVQFSLLDDGRKAGMHLFIPGYRESDKALAQIAYLMLDEALGEYDVETRLGLIEVLSPETPTDEKRYPLTELPERFDALVAKLEGKSGKPS